MAGNRTRVNCLEGSYAHHYTTNALLKAIIEDRHFEEKERQVKGKSWINEKSFKMSLP